MTDVAGAIGLNHREAWPLLGLLFIEIRLDYALV